MSIAGGTLPSRTRRPTAPTGSARPVRCRCTGWSPKARSSRRSGSCSPASGPSRSPCSAPARPRSPSCPTASSATWCPCGRLMPDPTIVPRRPRVRGAAPRSTTWWGRAFVRTFEETAYHESDLLAGRALARSGRLGAIMVLPSMASAVVDPETERAVMAQAKVAALPGEAWSTFVDGEAREAGHVAALEAGDLATALVEDADQAGAEILPAPAEIET